jgi:hypothetical protein
MLLAAELVLYIQTGKLLRMFPNVTPQPPKDAVAHSC